MRQKRLPIKNDEEETSLKTQASKGSDQNRKQKLDIPIPCLLTASSSMKLLVISTGKGMLEKIIWKPGAGTILTPKSSKRTFSEWSPELAQNSLQLAETPWHSAVKTTGMMCFLYSISIHLRNGLTLCLVLDILEEKDPHEHGEEEAGTAKDEADCSRNYRWSCEFRRGEPPSCCDPWSFYPWFLLLKAVFLSNPSSKAFP